MADKLLVCKNKRAVESCRINFVYGIIDGMLNHFQFVLGFYRVGDIPANAKDIVVVERNETVFEVLHNPVHIQIVESAGSLTGRDGFIEILFNAGISIRR